MANKRVLLLATVGLFSIAAVSFAQKRLGPKTRDTILDARVDPAFPTAGMVRLIFLPFANEIDYPEGAMILAENFIGAMRQKHPEISIVSPQDTKKLIQDEQLSSEYQTFEGHYLNTGVATMPFLQALGRTGKVDGIILGTIRAFGVSTQITTWGGWSWSKDRAVVGMGLTVIRTQDGRDLWSGTHVVQGEKNENVRELSKVVGDVFATYYGRPPY
jgi:hypothetical protein